MVPLPKRREHLSLNLLLNFGSRFLLAGCIDFKYFICADVKFEDRYEGERTIENGFNGVKESSIFVAVVGVIFRDSLLLQSLCTDEEFFN